MQAIVIAHNQEEREFFSYTLRHVGLSVARTSDIKLVASSLQANPVDLIFFAPNDDIPLLGEISRIRAISQAPLLLLIDSLLEEVYCEVLDAGVDLILKRPLSARILSRYARVFLRRSGSVPASMLASITVDQLQLDPSSRVVIRVDEDPVQLTPLEFRLLYVLMTNADQVIPTDVIIERVWGYTGDGNRELVRGLVRRLRRKVEPDPQNPAFIHTHLGIGYRFSGI